MVCCKMLSACANEKSIFLSLLNGTPNRWKRIIQRRSVTAPPPHQKKKTDTTNMPVCKLKGLQACRSLLVLINKQINKQNQPTKQPVNQPTKWARLLLKTLPVPRLLKTSRHFIEPRGSLPCSQKPATAPCLDPIKSSPRPPILLL
jgi:hypothetical protein